MLLSYRRTNNGPLTIIIIIIADALWQRCCSGVLVIQVCPFVFLSPFYYYSLWSCYDRTGQQIVVILLWCCCVANAPCQLLWMETTILILLLWFTCLVRSTVGFAAKKDVSGSRDCARGVSEWHIIISEESINSSVLFSVLPVVPRPLETKYKRPVWKIKSHLIFPLKIASLILACMLHVADGCF